MEAEKRKQAEAEEERSSKVRVEKWKCGQVQISENGQGIERISMPKCTVHVLKDERRGRQIANVDIGGRGGVRYDDD
ncbi:MAG: hypothetical protein ABIB97_05450 [Patescibacteria group bacterium]